MVHAIALMIMATIAVFGTLYIFSDRQDKKHAHK